MQRIISSHIQNVAGHYKGQCYSCDVVNEALEDDGTWRQSPSTYRPTHTLPLLPGCVPQHSAERGHVG
jgi:GH35 family endo-1,4-beta-xylanase